MAPKRKPTTKSTGKAANSNKALTPPDRETWPGWIEMESEPAFFNVMLNDMAVQGVKIQEVYGLDDEMLAFLPKPVHALIFLFRYRETDKEDLETECPDHIWYAEQVPEFACATVALLNIINNIPGLEMGKDLRDFKDFTQGMSPRLKGEAIDQFTFVKRIHNSFAREVDLLQAEHYYKEKQAKERKREAVAKALKTKAANAARKANAKATVESPKGSRTLARAKKPTPKSEESATPKLTPARSTRSSPRNRSGTEEAEKTNGKTAPSKDSHDATPTPGEATKSGDSSKKRKRSITADADEADENGPSPKKGKIPGTSQSGSAEEHDTPSKQSKSPASTPTKPNGITPKSDPEASEPTKTPQTNTRRKLKLKGPKNNFNLDGDYRSADQVVETGEQPRRSTRAPKPRQTKATVEAEDAEEEEDEEGFHFCAYIPIGDRVWKLDGMDHFPQDMGPIEEGKDWLSVAQPALQSRMAQYEAGAIEFNLMAVVHDPKLAFIDALAANVKSLQAVEAKLGSVVEDWNEMVDANDMIVTGEDTGLGLHNADIVRASVCEKDSKALAEAKDLAQLLALRDEIVLQQSGLVVACRDEVDTARSDSRKARTRRHDYPTFAREWVGALADQGVLDALIDDGDLDN